MTYDPNDYAEFGMSTDAQGRTTSWYRSHTNPERSYDTRAITEDSPPLKLCTYDHEERIEALNAKVAELTSDRAQIRNEAIEEVAQHIEQYNGKHTDMIFQELKVARIVRALKDGE